jgi:hypothetical protein
VTECQAVTVRRVIAAWPAWYRAHSNGERVTLASLYRAKVLQRRAWRGVEGDADAAHEYRLTDRFARMLSDSLAGAGQ